MSRGNPHILELMGSLSNTSDKFHLEHIVIARIDPLPFLSLRLLPGVKSRQQGPTASDASTRIVRSSKSSAHDGPKHSVDRRKVRAVSSLDHLGLPLKQDNGTVTHEKDEGAEHYASRMMPRDESEPGRCGETGAGQGRGREAGRDDTLGAERLGRPVASLGESNTFLALGAPSGDKEGELSVPQAGSLMPGRGSEAYSSGQGSVLRSDEEDSLKEVSNRLVVDNVESDTFVGGEPGAAIAEPEYVEDDDDEVDMFDLPCLSLLPIKSWLAFMEDMDRREAARAAHKTNESKNTSHENIDLARHGDGGFEDLVHDVAVDDGVPAGEPPSARNSTGKTHREGGLQLAVSYLKPSPVRSWVSLVQDTR